MSTALALPAGAYAFPVLSVMLTVVGVLPNAADHATTIRLPDAVAGIVHAVAGKLATPQAVA
jgi:hypothetical protein